MTKGELLRDSLEDRAMEFPNSETVEYSMYRYLKENLKFNRLDIIIHAQRTNDLGAKP